MPLNEAQKQRLTDWMQAKAVQAPCPACAADQWAPGDLVAESGVDAKGNIRFSGGLVLLVQVVCGNCGCVMHFDAKLIGLIER